MSKTQRTWLGIVLLLVGILGNAALMFIYYKQPTTKWQILTILGALSACSFTVSIFCLVPRAPVAVGEVIGYVLLTITRARKGEALPRPPSDRDLSLTLPPDTAMPAVPDPRAPLTKVTVEVPHDGAP